MRCVAITRVKLETDSLNLLFDTLEDANYSLREIANLLGVHPRTIRDWRSGRFTMSTEALVRPSELVGINQDDLDIQRLPQWWQTSRAGKLGGKSYIEKYGAPGTTESRKIAGHVSYNKRSTINGDIFQKKAIREPNMSCELAEFIGIMIGDGHVGKYQASIALDIKTDIEYCEFVSKTISCLFGIDATIQVRSDKGCVCVVVSSIEFTDFLVRLGLPRGNKIRNRLDIPDWVFGNSEYSRACLRGIFDTDGSIFQETHTIRGKTYAYPRMTFTSYSEPLRESIYKILYELELDIKMRSDRNVNIERFTDIDKYFRIIGSSNPKHMRRFVAFGGVG